MVDIEEGRLSFGKMRIGRIGTREVEKKNGEGQRKYECKEVRNYDGIGSEWVNKIIQASSEPYKSVGHILHSCYPYTSI